MLRGLPEAPPLNKYHSWDSTPFTWPESQLPYGTALPPHPPPPAISGGGLTQEGRASPCSALAGDLYIGQLKFFAAVHMSTNDLESTAWFDSEVTNTFSQVSKFTETESANNDNQLSV